MCYHFQLLIPRDSIKIYISKKMQMFFSLVEWSKCHGGSKVQPLIQIMMTSEGAYLVRLCQRILSAGPYLFGRTRPRRLAFSLGIPVFFSGKPPLETVKDPLKCLPSTKPTISTTSSFANFQKQATGGQNPFREKGTGCVGKVFAQDGTIWAFKAFMINRTINGGRSLHCT